MLKESEKTAKEVWNTCVLCTVDCVADDLEKSKRSKEAEEQSTLALTVLSLGMSIFLHIHLLFVIRMLHSDPLCICFSSSRLQQSCFSACTQITQRPRDPRGAYPLQCLAVFLTLAWRWVSDGLCKHERLCCCPTSFPLLEERVLLRQPR